jgi:glycosyltransferase involved in cell wall biosynthesis
MPFSADTQTNQNYWSISLVLNCHREGLLIAASFRSLEAAATQLALSNIPVEVLICLDRPDTITLETSEVLRDRCPFPVRLLKVNYGDLSQSRNFAVEAAIHHWIAFLDADDLWSVNWLEAAFAYLQTSDKPESLILHPQINLFFPEQYIHIMPNQEQLKDPLGILLADNIWDSLSLAYRSIYLRHPYRPNLLSNGFGYEDWAWNHETIQAGFIHRIVNKTCHFKRRSPNSLSKRSQELSVLVTPPRV